MYVQIKRTHARIQEVFQRRSNFDNFFLVDEGREDPNTTIDHRPVIVKWAVIGSKGGWKLSTI